MATPLIVSGEYHGKHITIFGEIHNHIDQTFYDQLDLNGKSIWVEHSTALCDLLPEYVQFFANAKGSEWIWFTRKQKELPVVCIDTRIKMGLLSRIEEVGIQTLLDNVVSLPSMIDAIIQFIPKVEQVQEQFEKLIELSFIQPYDYIFKELLTTINKQKLSIEATDFESLTSESLEELHTTCKNLYTNLVDISSILVDIVIISFIERYKGTQPIHLFVGFNHAVRLQHLLSLELASEMKQVPKGFNVEERTRNVLAQLPNKPPSKSASAVNEVDGGRNFRRRSTRKIRRKLK